MERVTVKIPVSPSSRLPKALNDWRVNRNGAPENYILCEYNQYDTVLLIGSQNDSYRVSEVPYEECELVLDDGDSRFVRVNEGGAFLESTDD